MTSFAIVLRSRRHRVDGVLMILDERAEANEIAFTLRQKGQDVEVVEFTEFTEGAGPGADDPPG